MYHYFDNLLPDSPQVRDRIVRRYQARSKQPFDLLAEVGRDSVGAVTLLPPGKRRTGRITLADAGRGAAHRFADRLPVGYPLGMITGRDDFRISVAGAEENGAAADGRSLVYSAGRHADHAYH